MTSNLNCFRPYMGERNGFMDRKCYLLVSYDSLKEKVEELQKGISRQKGDAGSSA